jgi:hypothetical protein
VSNRGEQKLLKQSTVLMFAVAIAGIVTGFIRVPNPSCSMGFSL